MDPANNSTESCRVWRAAPFQTSELVAALSAYGSVHFSATLQRVNLTFFTSDPPVFVEDGIHIARNGRVVWKDPRRSCEGERSCDYLGKKADEFLDQMAKGGTLRMEFEIGGLAHEVSWDLTGMDEALTDYRTQATARGLL